MGVDPDLFPDRERVSMANIDTYSFQEKVKVDVGVIKHEPQGSELCEAKEVHNIIAFIGHLSKLKCVIAGRLADGLDEFYRSPK